MTSPGGIRLVERETRRTARYAAIGAAPENARRIWIALHGYGQLAPRFLRPFEGIVPADTLVVAPEGLSRFYLESPRADGGHLQRIGATWLTRESRETEIRDAHDWLDLVLGEVTASARASGVEPVVGVLAFSQGVATAMRWIADRRVRPRVLVVWAGGVAQDVDAPAFREAVAHGDVVLVAGDRDTFATPERFTETEQRLRTLGERLAVRRFEGEHTLHRETLAELLHSMPEP